MAALLLTIVPTVANAQNLYGQRLQGANGWLLPVASVLLGSDESDHLRRGSVNAWDLSASVGSPVWAMGSGRVTYAGCNNSGGYGCWVMIDHGNELVASYAHCLERSIRVQSGQTVDANTQLCNIGRTGQTSWPHLHLVIKYQGVHQRIDRFFDRRQMHYCHFTRCQATNAPDASVYGAQPNHQAPVKVESAGQRIVRVMVATLTGMGTTLFPLLFVTILAALLAFWLANNTIRMVMIATVVCVVVSVTVALLFMPTYATAGPQMTGNLWEYAHDLTMGSEGWKCTNDGAYTAGGITQGTYSSWRQSKGLPITDVCRTLTKKVRKAIFFEKYWMASGADQLPPMLALTYVDHYFNTGEGKAGVALCGTNVKCFNDWRVMDYQSKRNCNRYCNGWISRVNKFRRITEGNYL